MSDSRHRNRISLLLRFLLAIALLVATVRFAASDFANVSATLAQAACWPIVAVVFLFLLTRLTDALYMSALYRPAAPTLTFRGSLRLVIIQGVAALAIPRFGNIAGAAWLKTSHGLGILKFSGIHIAATLINAGLIAVLGFMAAWFVPQPQREPIALAILLCAFATVVLSLALISRQKIARGSRWRDALADAHEGFSSISSRPARLPAILLLQGWSMLARTARIGFSILAISAVWPNSAGLVEAGAIADLATLVALTPAGLGLREAAATATANVAGVTAEIMLAGVLLDRMIGIAGTLLLGIPLLWSSSHEKAD